MSRTKLLTLDEIKFPESRQRREYKNIESLAESIAKHGLIHEPIIEDESNTLVVGGRRLRALELFRKERPRAFLSRYKNGKIPFKVFSSLSPFELKLIELEENLQREDLTWQEETLAVHDYHVARVAHDFDNWTQDMTAEELGKSLNYISRRLRVAYAIVKANTRVLSCETFGSAVNVLEREDSRIVDTELYSILDTDAEKIDLEMPSARDDYEAGLIPGTAHAPPTLSSVNSPASSDIMVADFNEVAKAYSGPPFNFIHCDFPYGIGHDRTDQGGAKRHGSFEDTEQVFWRLCDSLLHYGDKLIAPSAHIMFWFSMNHYQLVKKAFEKYGFSVNPFPLIWYKSDNIGILPDPKRGPRRIYETAFLISRGDRKIVKPVSNLISCKSGKKSASHISEKPYLVLAHFFTMFVDKTTRMLDPTCGSGTAINCAQSLWANTVKGFDLNQVYVDIAIGRLNTLRLTMSGGEEECMDTASTTS